MLFGAGHLYMVSIEHIVSAKQGLLGIRPEPVPPPTHRSLAPTATIKKSITRRALQMSLENNIVTPLTAMVMENAAGNERMLADSPPLDPSCCSGVLGGRGLWGWEDISRL